MLPEAVPAQVHLQGCLTVLTPRPSIRSPALPDSKCLPDQAWGLHGWRCGYIAYPNHDGKDYVGEHLIRRGSRLLQQGPVSCIHAVAPGVWGSLGGGRQG